MRKILGVFVLMGACILSGCSKNEENTNTNSFQGEYIVSSNYAKDKAKDSNTILVNIKEEKSSQTLKNSLIMDADYLTEIIETEDGEDIKANIYDPKKLSVKLGDLGLDKNKEILLYSSENNGIEAKVLHQLLYSGYEYVKIVDGGYEALISSGLEKGKPREIQKTKVKITETDKSRILTKEELNKDDKDFVVVSLDEAEEKIDKKDEIQDENVESNSSEVINIEYEKFFNKDNTLNDMKEIKSVLKDENIRMNDNIVLYSKDGIKSAYAQVILEMCGYKNSKYIESVENESIDKEVDSEVLDEKKELEEVKNEEVRKELDNNSDDLVIIRPNTSKPNTTRPNTSTGNNSTSNPNRPNTGTGTNKPSGGSGANKPSTGGGTNKPSTGGSTSKPNPGGSGGSSSDDNSSGGNTDGNTGGGSSGGTTNPDSGGESTGGDSDSSFEGNDLLN